jgi:hypothetical protein
LLRVLSASKSWADATRRRAADAETGARLASTRTHNNQTKRRSSLFVIAQGWQMTLDGKIVGCKAEREGVFFGQQ